MRLIDKVSNQSAISQWTLLASVLVFFGILVSFNLYIDHARTEEREVSRLKAQVRVLADNIQNQLASADKVLSSASVKISNAKNASEIKEAELQLTAIIGFVPGIHHIGVIDSDGKLIFSNVSQYVGKNFSYRDYFQAVKNNPRSDMLYISPPYKNVLGEYVINVSRMISGPSGEFSGIVTASLYPEYFKTLMTSMLYAPDMWDALAHGDGLLFLMMPGRESLYGTNLAKPGTFFSKHKASGQMLSVMSGRVYATNEVRMLVQQTINAADLKMDKPLVVAVSRDLHDVFQDWREDVAVQLGLFGLLNLISIYGLYVYQYRQRILQRQADIAKEHASRLSVALDHIPAYIYMKDKERRYVYANKPTLELFECTASELQGCKDARFFPPETVARLHDIDTSVLEQGNDSTQEVISHDADGTKKVYWEIKTPIFDGAGKTGIWGLCGISTDITKLQNRELALRESEERFRLTFDSAPIGMALISLEGRFLQVNQALVNILGYTRDELLQKTFQEITHPDDLESDLANKEALEAGDLPGFQMEKRYIDKGGDIRWIMLNASAVRDAAENVLYFIAQIQDITERRSLMEKLALQASYDYLTNLYNRRFFIGHAEAEFARARRYGKSLALLMLDIDFFKNINDTFGHKTGDVVLQRFSALLLEKLRTVDIIGRIGGEEFAVLLPESKEQDALDVAERLREDIAETEIILEGGKVVHFTVSMGVAVLNEHTESLDVLFGKADQALYQAKNSGRNKVCLAK